MRNREFYFNECYRKEQFTIDKCRFERRIDKNKKIIPLFVILLLEWEKFVWVIRPFLSRCRWFDQSNRGFSLVLCGKSSEVNSFCWFRSAGHLEIKRCIHRQLYVDRLKVHSMLKNIEYFQEDLKKFFQDALGSNSWNKDLHQD